MKKAKKIVMYLDGVKSTHKDVLKEALDNYVDLRDMKQQLIERFHGHDVTFITE